MICYNLLSLHIEKFYLLRKENGIFFFQAGVLLGACEVQYVSMLSHLTTSDGGYSSLLDVLEEIKEDCLYEPLWSGGGLVAENNRITDIRLEGLWFESMGLTYLDMDRTWNWTWTWNCSSPGGLSLHHCRSAPEQGTLLPQHLLPRRRPWLPTALCVHCVFTVCCCAVFTWMG